MKLKVYPQILFFFKAFLDIGWKTVISKPRQFSLKQVRDLNLPLGETVPLI